MPTSTTGTIAVIGATGQQGGAVARHLLGRGVQVRALVRDPQSAAAQRLIADGAGVVTADLRDAPSVLSALRGVEAVFAMSTFTEDGTDGEVRQGQVIGDAASAAGIERVVYSSVGGAERSTGIPHFESKWIIEEYLRDAGLDLTVIRPVFFMDNLTGAAAPSSDSSDAAEQVFRFPLAPGVPLQMISVQDIGAIGAQALLDPNSIPGGELEIGADEVTPEQIAQAIGEHTGRTTRFEPLPFADLPDDDQRAMFTWFSQAPAYRADFTATAALRPELLRFSDFLKTVE